MKFLICGWRPWSRYRYESLITNSLRLGHEVIAVASDQFGVGLRDLTRETFEELGIRVIIGDDKQLRQQLDEFQPDAVFGEQYWHNREEACARRWAYSHNKQHLVLDHGKNYHVDHGPVLHHHSNLPAKSTILCATERAAEIVRPRTQAKVVVVGQPQYDLIKPSYDADGIKESLGVEPRQRLIAMSLTFMDVRGQPYHGEAEYLLPLLNLADEKGWKIVCSPHPTERVAKNRLKHKSRGPYLRSMQEQGVTFVSDFPEGVADGVEFKRCHIFDLIAAADAVTGSSETIAWQCYALGKTYFPFAQTWFGFVNTIKPGKKFENLIDVVENGLDWWVRDDKTDRLFFYKLDGLCWRRILGVLA